MISSIYTKDWFNRTGDYILKNTDIEIGFAKTPDNIYSQFLYSYYKAEQICSDINLMTKEMAGMISALGLSNIRFKLSETVETACTDGNLIYVGVGEKYKSITDAYEKIDRVIGMTIHECCHCLYTDFSYIKYNISPSDYLVHHIHNIIEDEMIENKLCLKYPGYANFLSKLKYNIFENEADESNNDNSELNVILQILFYLIRYPKLLANIDQDTLNKYEHIFVDIKKIMKDEKCFITDNHRCTEASTNAAKKIVKYLNDFIEKENCENTETSEKSDVSNNKNNTSNNSNNDMIDVNVIDKSEINNNEDNSINSENSENSENPEILTVLDKINEIICSTSEVSDITIINVIHDRIKETDKKVSEWENQTQKNKLNTSNIHDSSNTDIYKYNSYLNDVKNYINVARNLIIPNKKSTEYVNERFRRNGSLDSTRLANAMCNEQNVYNQKSFKINNLDPKYALVILVDESGSMTSDNAHIFASKLTILLYEALYKYNNIKLFIYGHGDCIYRYIDPTKNNKYVLGYRHQQWDQNEIVTYESVINDVKKQTNLPIVVFNITDSFYCVDTYKLKNTIDKINDESTNKVVFNLFVLDHGNSKNYIKTSNNLIYGDNQYVIYDHTLFNRNHDLFINALKQFAKIILFNFKKNK